MSAPFEIGGGKVRLHVRLTPRGGRDAIEGWRRDSSGNSHLKVRVTAPPEDGKANNALLGLLAKEFRIAKSAIRIVSGEKARSKLIEFEGDAGRLKNLGQVE